MAVELSAAATGVGATGVESVEFAATVVLPEAVGVVTVTVVLPESVGP